jgi:hypothetical protein
MKGSIAFFVMVFAMILFLVSLILKSAGVHGFDWRWLIFAAGTSFMLTIATE